MSKRNTLIAMAMGLSLLAMTPAFADKMGTGKLGSQDEKFMMDAAKGGMMEVEMGRLAIQKASSADVKSFGQRMVDDHSKANSRLKSIASEKGVTLPTTLPADMRQDMDKMSKLSGAEFDKMYMSHMLKDHKKDVAEFEKEANKGGDSNVKSFAQETLPTLREHLTMAQSIAGKVGAGMDDHAMHGGKSGS